MFEWDDGNQSEVEDHNLAMAECEQAFGDPHRLARRAASDRGEPRAGIIGTTEAGRVIVVIYTLRAGRLRVVTAWPATGGDMRAYQEANHD